MEYELIILLFILLYILWRILSYPENKPNTHSENIEWKVKSSGRGGWKGDKVITSEDLEPPKSHWEKLKTPLKYKNTIDERGYKRNGYGRLIHRDKAEKLIYKKGDYPLEFWQYDVHHKDGNKLNNLKDNLEILTREEHNRRH